jgi:hypothetical protein
MNFTYEYSGFYDRDYSITEYCWRTKECISLRMLYKFV